MPAETIYLDHAASTPCDPAVVEAMLPYFTDRFANPSSRAHRPGQAAFADLEAFRARVARALGAASPTEIVFTASATESNNLALKGGALWRDARRSHLVSQVTEHASVLAPLAQLEATGRTVTLAPVDDTGVVDLDALGQAIGDDTLMVSVMLANNETGVVQPVAEIAEVAHARGALVHCDAAQAPGKIPLDLGGLGADLVSIASHKVYGPKGIGALYVRRCSPPIRLEPVLAGGGHEGGVRSSTPNLAAAAGFATAVELAASRVSADAGRLRLLQSSFEARIRTEIPDVVVNGAGAERLPGFSNLAFPGVDGEALLMSLPSLAVSSGSACTSGHPEPSSVLRAMGLDPRLAGSALRISFGRDSTDDDATRAAALIAREARRLAS